MKLIYFLEKRINVRRDYLLFDSMAFFLYNMNSELECVYENSIKFVDEVGDDDGIF